MNKPKYHVYLNNNIIEKSFSAALKKRGNFFSNVRLTFKREIELIFQEQGININSEKMLASSNLDKNHNIIEKKIVTKYTGYSNDTKIYIDSKFCAKYGHDDYSIKALNYIDREYCDFPSLLPFIKIENFFLGNILILVDNGNYKICIDTEQGLDIIGYTFDISAKKRKSYVCLLGVHFDHALLQALYNKYLQKCSHDVDSLDEIRINTSFFPITFICRTCGKIFTCSCFKDYLNINSGLVVRRDDIEVKSNICHLCTGNIPTIQYPCSPTPSSFLLRYMPYHHLISLRKYGRFIFSQDKEYKNIENEVRVLFGYPEIGESWFTETMLYKLIQFLFPSLEVIHHYRGAELEGLEIDIWIPELKVGIEYQGIQHYKVVEHWGGKEGLLKRVENDKKKKGICNVLGYMLIEFHHNETLTEEFVVNKLTKHGIL
mgnify:CR=1 FL=1